MDAISPMRWMVPAITARATDAVPTIVRVLGGVRDPRRFSTHHHAVAIAVITMKNPVATGGLSQKQNSVLTKLKIVGIRNGTPPTTINE